MKRSVSLKHCSVFLKRSVSTHQYIIIIYQHLIIICFFPLNCINMMSAGGRPAIGTVRCFRPQADIGPLLARHWLNAMLGSKRTLARHQPAIGWLPCLGGKRTLGYRWHALGSMPCLLWQADVGPTTAQWAKAACQLLLMSNPIHHAGVLSLTLHFMQLLYQQFHPIPLAFSMHMLIIKLSFLSEKLTPLLSFLETNGE